MEGAPGRIRDAVYLQRHLIVDVARRSTRVRTFGNEAYLQVGTCFRPRRGLFERNIHPLIDGEGPQEQKRDGYRRREQHASLESKDRAKDPQGEELWNHVIRSRGLAERGQNGNDRTVRAALASRLDA